MPSKTPDQYQWTLRFKLHKTTILLFVDQGQSFTSIKQELLEAIKATGRSAINGQTLPSDPEDVVLAVPVDKNDLSKGWVGMEIPELDGDDGIGGKKVNGKNSVLNSTPLGAGLKDGAVLAFKFRNETEAKDELDLDDDNWDVVLPNFEEEYGSQSQGQG